MSIVEFLSQFIDVSGAKLNAHEKLLLEAEFFTFFCKELENFLSKSNEYLGLCISCQFNEEDGYMNFKLGRYLINDILKTDYYSLDGLSICTGVPVDVLEDIFNGRNRMPSASLVIKLIEVHKSINFELYKNLVSKMFSRA